MLKDFNKIKISQALFKQCTQNLTAVHTNIHKDEERESIERRIKKNCDLLSLQGIETLLQCRYITSLMDKAAAALGDEFARPFAVHGHEGCSHTSNASDIPQESYGVC